jgi:signal transduction histidine kinase
VDDAGNAVDEPRVTPGRDLTPVERTGQRIALIDHARGAGPAIAHALGPALLTAIENEQLLAQLLSQRGSLVESRRRIIERGESERRRLERNLHDGAQQRLLALSFDLHLARAQANGLGAPCTMAAIDAAIVATGDAIRELRDLAHGIFPTILAEAGLVAAVETLADTAAIPVELELETDELPPDAVASAAYLIAARSLDAAERLQATRTEVKAVIPCSTN